MGTGTTLKQLWKSWTAQIIIIIIKKKQRGGGGRRGSSRSTYYTTCYSYYHAYYSVKLIVSLATSASTSRVVLEIEEENIIISNGTATVVRKISPLYLLFSSLFILIIMCYSSILCRQQYNYSILILSLLLPNINNKRKKCNDNRNKRESTINENRRMMNQNN